MQSAGLIENSVFCSYKTHLASTATNVAHQTDAETISLIPHKLAIVVNSYNVGGADGEASEPCRCILYRLPVNPATKAVSRAVAHDAHGQ